MNLFEEFEKNQQQALNEKRPMPTFAPGDTLRVNVRIIEGSVERVQAFEGVCIAKRNRGLNSSFTVRKISHGEGVERIFPLYSPRLESIQVVRKGEVRRAKLYYLRDLAGKAARIREKIDFLRPEDAASKGGADAADTGEAQQPVKKAATGS